MCTVLCVIRNYPSAENIERKARERKDRQARGEVLSTKHNRWILDDCFFSGRTTTVTYKMLSYCRKTAL